MTWLRHHFTHIRALLTVVAAVAIAAFVAELIVAGAHSAEMRSCHRLNIFRGRSNYNWLQVYGAFLAADLQDPALGLRADADELSWVPLTDCHLAVFTNRRPPEPIRFRDRLPTAAAFTPGPKN